MEQKKSSRVYQLRDLFQSGKPRPSEELNNMNVKRPASNSHSTKTIINYSQNRVHSVPKQVKEESISEFDSASVRSMSDLSDPDVAFIANDIPFSVRKASSSSDSDIDSPRSDHPDKEADHKTFNNPSNHINQNEIDTSILCPIVPFSGNQPTKMRPLGEEFRIRRNVRSTQSPTKNNENVSPVINSTSTSKDSSQNHIPSPVDKGPKSPIKEHKISNKDTNPNSQRKLLEPNSLISKNCDDDVVDSDVDAHETELLSLDKSIEKPFSTLDDVVDSFVSNQMTKSDNIPTPENDDVFLSPSIDRINNRQIGDILSTNEIEPALICNPEFQDFILEPEHFQFENMMKAESVDLEDRTASDDEYYDYDDEEGDNDYDNDDHDLDMPYPFAEAVIPFEMICPKPKEIISIKSGCHILEDGHFFYERAVEIDSDTESELESQNILSNNDIVKTYKRPGAVVHFNLNKVRVYSTHIAGDYNRKNEDIDPLSSAAEYEMEKRLEQMEIFPVELFKGITGLGISILGMGVGHSSGLQKLGIFVKSIAEGGAADKDGRIRIYDQIVEVNGNSLVSVSQDYAASVLRNTHGMVKFLIGREIDQTNSEIVRLVERARQMAGLVSEPNVISPASSADTEHHLVKSKSSLNSKPMYPPDIPDTSPSILFKGDDNQQNKPLETDVSSNPPTEVSEMSVESLKCIINDLNHRLNDSRVNEQKMSTIISGLRSDIERNMNLKTELASLSANYETVQSELHEKLHLVDNLSVENCTLKEKLEKTTKKYKQLKRLDKIAEIKNGNQNHNGDEQHDLITFYENKVKTLEDQVMSLELQLANNRNKSELNFSYDDVSSLHMDKDYKNKYVQRSALKKTSVTDSVISQRHDGDKVLINLKINLAKNNAESLDDRLSDKVGRDTMLDNGLAKNKVELRKTGARANRKPPSKSMMIGDKSIDMMDSHVNVNKHMSLSDITSSVAEHESNDIEDCQNESSVENSSNKSNISKVFGGFALPGMNEIRLGSKKLEKGLDDNTECSQTSVDMCRKSQASDNFNIPLNKHPINTKNSILIPHDSPNGDSPTSKPCNDNGQPMYNLSKQSNVPNVTTVDSNGTYKTKL